ncbi:alpha/beta fold hydrolase [Nocardioides daeguensis]|uniref:Alpha/beta fold hydrolase n=1 Tax=Nocardioides daeguensis TaxID=908359 RepID=A0ABP6VES6_9ACTN|nr:alpha/beta fold hydrolase [Nocardioides daeguensis]MBV6726078.1 alpha/beta fold hydrolase [Nocardioides daeguensis]MCR1771921.1 alpha/beta fold hydrolase [Nocardioides daeguensis]
MAEPKSVTTVERDGLVFDVLVDGPPDGEPILLLHGFPERATSWRLVAPLLHEAGYRTLAMDQRGYSRGARPRRRRDYRASELMADALTVVDALVGPQGRAHVVGHDWGAIPAWLLAAHHADRVASLTAVSVPHPQAFLTAMVRSEQLLKSWYMLAFQLPRLPELVLGRTDDLAARQLRAAGFTAEDVARFRTEIVEDGALPTALNWYRALPLGDPRLMRRRVSVPTTMVWSDQDVALSRWGAEHAGDWVDGPYRFVELGGVSHWIPTQAPEALADAILHRVRSTDPAS